MLHSCWYVSNSRCFSNNFNLKLGWSGFLLQVHGHLECAILISNNVQKYWALGDVNCFACLFVSHVEWYWQHESWWQLDHCIVTSLGKFGF